MRYREIQSKDRRYHGDPDLHSLFPWFARAFGFCTCHTPDGRHAGSVREARHWVREQFGPSDNEFLLTLAYARHTPAYKLGHWGGRIAGFSGAGWVQIGSDFWFEDPVAATAFKIRWC